jgi:translation initiation factor 1
LPQKKHSQKKQPATPNDGVVRLRRQTKGRKGAGVTLVQGLVGSADELKQVAKWLKSQCGVGGSVKEGVIELQSADRERIAELLSSKGYTVKIAGG